MDADDPAEPGELPKRPAPILVPELRDYQRINAEVVRRLDRGQRHVRLEGVEGQRLLAAGLAGGWQALIEIEGQAGPELAAGLDAPGLTVVCRGPAADGAGRGLSAGRLVVLGPAGTAMGYVQSGGLIVAAAAVGPRAGLGQIGGAIILLDRCGPLAGERQSGGRIFLCLDRAGPHLRHGARGGRLVAIDLARGLAAGSEDDDEVLRQALALVNRFHTNT